MSTSTDGGLTWGAAKTNNAGVIGGQPVVRPNGTVIVPTDNANETAVGAFNSTNGGASWSAVTTIATISHHTEAAAYAMARCPPLEVDGAGTVYVVWSDCRFERSCKANDLVISHSTNSTGTTWSAVSRIPDRRGRQRHGSLYSGPGGQQEHLRRDRPAWVDLLLLSEVGLRHRCCSMWASSPPPMVAAPGARPPSSLGRSM